MKSKIGFKDFQNMGTKEVLNEVAKQTSSKTEKHISTAEDLIKKVQALSANHGQIVAEQRKHAELAEAADKAINVATSLSDLEANDKLVATIKQLEDEMGKMSQNGSEANQGDVGDVKGRLILLQQLKGTTGGNAEWQAITKLAIEAKKAGALVQIEDAKSSLRFVVGGDWREIFFVEAEKLGRVNRMISTEIHRIYAEKKAAEKAAFQDRLAKEKEAKQRLFKRNNRISYGELVAGKAGSVIIVVHKVRTDDNERPHEIGAFVIESNGTTATATEPTSERVESLLSKHGCFREFSVQNTDSYPGLLQKLIQEDQKYREERKAETEEHREALAAKADITLAEANEGRKGTFYVPVDKFRDKRSGRFVSGAFLARRNADGRAQIVESIGEAGKLIPDPAYTHTLAWEEFCQNFILAIKMPLQWQARKENILLPGMTPMEERTSSAPEQAKGETSSEATE